MSDIDRRRGNSSSGNIVKRTTRNGNHEVVGNEEHPVIDRVHQLSICKLDCGRSKRLPSGR